MYRFSFLMVFTLLCAALTVSLFIVGNISEGHWKWDERTYLEYTSAVQTGMYYSGTLGTKQIILSTLPSRSGTEKTTSQPGETTTENA